MENLDKDVFADIMDWYHPDAHVGKKKKARANGTMNGKKDVRQMELNRAVDIEEVRAVRKTARDTGLWRCVGAPEHGRVRYMSGSENTSAVLSEPLSGVRVQSCDH